MKAEVETGSGACRSCDGEVETGMMKAEVETGSGACRSCDEGRGRNREWSM